MHIALLAERNARVEYDRPGVLGLETRVSAHTRERVQALSDPVGVEFEAAQMRPEHLAHCDLPRLCDVEQLAQVVDEQVDAVCLKYLANQSAVDVELSLYVGQRAPDLRQAMILADGIQDVRFDEVEERERGRRAASHRENGFEVAHP